MISLRVEVSNDLDPFILKKKAGTGWFPLTPQRFGNVLI